MSRATADIGTMRYATTIDANGFALVSDEPVARDGGGRGPGPYDLLLASLAACTAITLRMYADRKQWDMRSLRVDLNFTRRGGTEHIDRTLRPEGALNDEQRARLVEIADKTPVTLTLKRSLTITTSIAPETTAGAAPSRVTAPSE